MKTSSSVQRLEDGSGNHRRPAGAVVSEEQPTVISHQPPLEVTPPPNEGPPRLGLEHLVPGTRMGNYELLEFVGGGGMGRVFRALDLSLGRVVALKVLSCQQAADGETLLRFRSEARNAARLNHDNIVQVFFAGEETGMPYIAFEYVEGMNLRVLVEQRGPLPLAEAVSYTIQVAEALAHAAERRVVHRDIKPSNVLVTPDGHAKLIDMGLARLQKLGESSEDLTASGVTLGTFDYISPEQAVDPRNADVRSDLYSLGCTLFFMLCGRPPFPEGTVLQKLLQHQGDEPPDVRAFRPDLPEEISRVVRKMMAKDPRRRYLDPSKLILSLLGVAEQIGLQPSGLGRTFWVVPKESSGGFVERHLPWIAPVAALGIIVVLLNFLWTLPPFQTAEPSPDWAASLQDAAGPEGPSPAPRTLPTSAVPDVNAAKPSAAGEPKPPSPGVKPPGAGDASASSAITANPPPSGNPLAPPPAAPVKTSVSTGPPPQPAGLGSAALPPAASQLRVGAAAGGTAGTQPAAAPPKALAADVPAASATNAGRLLVVDPAARAAGGADAPASLYATLAAACAAAQPGDVVELRFSGRLEERPLVMDTASLTVRAGEGYRPVIAFQPAETVSWSRPRGMMTLDGCRLKLQGVALEFDVPRDVAAEDWSLILLGSGDVASLERCSLTIRNASDRQTAVHPDVAFFRTTPPTEPDIIWGSSPEASPEPVTLELADCVARGEAQFINVDGLQPVQLIWRNGLLATTEPLLVAKGGQAGPRENSVVTVRLTHLTAMVQRGLYRFAGDSAALTQPLVDFNAKGCIFLGEGGSPLIEQSGVAGNDDPLGFLSWQGDHDFYEGFNVFWSARLLSQEAPSKVLNFEAWKAHWLERESQPALNQVVWQHRPEAGRAVHQHTVADYALSGENNPAVGAAGDDRDAGLLSTELPVLPE